MPYIETTDCSSLEGSSNIQIYNAMDCLLTFEILDALNDLPDNNKNLIYNFELALQAPVLEMTLRGFKIDMAARHEAIALVKARLVEVDDILQKFANAVWGKNINPNSGPQLKSLLYTYLHIKPVASYKGGEEKYPMDRKTLEKLDSQLWARPIVSTVLASRDLLKQLQVLETELDGDNRFRTSFNIAGTSTGRWSSSKSSTGTGSNLQNIAAELRHVYVADPGYNLYGYDLEQTESREVGFLCGILFDDWRYLDSCEHGDLHTTVCRLIWPKLGWTGDEKSDRKIADQKYYRDMSYRDLAKRGGHGCLTEDHEVLTPDGWVSISTKPRIIMQWEGEKSSFTEVSSWTDFMFTGFMYEWENEDLSINMTDSHRVYYYDFEDIISRREDGRTFHALKPGVMHRVANPEHVPENAVIPLSNTTTFTQLAFLHLNATTKGKYYQNIPTRVFCPTVPSGAFYIRRKGRTSVTGNSNYLLKPKTAAEHLKIPVAMAEEFQYNYFGNFPAIPKFHSWVAEQIQTKMSLTNIFGRRRDFFDRPDSDITLRKAVAYLPQSATGDRLNLGLYRMWRYMPQIELIAQVHDAVYFQAPEHFEPELINHEVLKLLEIPLYFKGRKFVIPAEGKMGKNWGNFDAKNPEKNPYGLKKLKF